MSVIVTGMDMPERCHTCGLKLKGTCPRLIKSVSVLQKTRLEDCPLKSIDGLINKVYQLDFDYGDYYDHTSEIQDKIIATIKEYCDTVNGKE